jgi:hypothetical protein
MVAGTIFFQCFRIHFCTAIATYAVQIQGMVQDIEIQQFTYHGLDIVDAGITKFHYLMAVGTDKVIMLPVAVRLFILCQVPAKLVLAGEVALYQQVERVVHGSPAYAVIFVFHADVEGFYIKMAVAGINFFKDGIPLRRFPQAFIFQICRKNFFHFREHCLI